MGLIDASKPRAYRPRGILDPVSDETTSTATMDYSTIGGETMNNDPRGAGRDQRSFESFGAMIRDPDFRNDWSEIAGKFGSLGMFGSAIRDMTGLGKEAYGPAMPAFGTRDAVADEIGSAAMGSNLDLAGSVGESPGLYAKGGKVGRRGLLDGDPPGPDNVIIGAKTGERVLNEKQFGALSPEARAEVERVLKAKKK